MPELSPKLDAILILMSECSESHTPLPNEIFDTIQDRPEFGVEILDWLSYEQNLVEVSNTRLTCMLQFIEFSLSQLKSSFDLKVRGSENILNQFSDALANIILNNPNLNLIRALFNIFIDAGLTIDEDIKEDYLQLVSSRVGELAEEVDKNDDAVEIKDIDDDSDITAYEIAQALFVESSALPHDYILAFLQDLIDVDSVKSLNTAILFLLHPLKAAREVALENLQPLFSKIVLSPISLHRLIKINHWLNNDKVANLIQLNQQRQTASLTLESPNLSVYATEIDSAGSQALFFIVKHNKNDYQSAGIVLKKKFGLKDAWISDYLTKEEAMEPINHGKEQGLVLKKVNLEYANTLINHTLAETLDEDHIPDIHTLELSDYLNQEWRPQQINFKDLLKTLSEKALVLEDKDWQEKSLSRSQKWPQTKSHFSTWFFESSDVDVVVNQNSSFREGIKFCDVEKATKAILNSVFEKERAAWFENFLFLAYWSSVSARKNELFWKDCLLIAALIDKGVPMQDIPILDKIAKESIVHSLETMEQRKSHLA